MKGTIDRIAYSKAEAAEMLGLCLRTIDNMIADKQLIARKIGRRVIIPAAVLYGRMGTLPKTYTAVHRIAYTKAEAAQAIGVSVRTIENLLAARELSTRRVRGGVRIPADSLYALLRSDHGTKRAESDRRQPPAHRRGVVASERHDQLTSLRGPIG